MYELASYEEFLKGREMAENTCDMYLRVTRKFLEYVGERALTKEMVLSYKQQLLEQKYSTTTINAYLIAINNYLRYLGREECTIRTMRVQKKASLENVINMSEYQEMLSYAKSSGQEKYYYIMKTLALTGIRVSELQFFTVEALSQKQIEVCNKGKNREIYLPDCLIRELKTYCRKKGISEGVIFLGKDNKPISRITVYKKIAYLADMLGIAKEKAHPHSFRHFFAVTYINQYANLAELADILGHSSMETTRIYTVSSSEEKRKRLNRLGL